MQANPGIAALAALLAVTAASAQIEPSDYPAFSDFAGQHFTHDADPLVEEWFGQSLQPPEDWWEYVSERSASVAFHTVVPAYSTVEYGQDGSFDHVSESLDRPYSNHLHHLTGLQPGQSYQYRVVLETDDGQQLVSAARDLTPESMSQAVRIPDDMSGPPPYSLDTAETTYLLTEDLTINGRAFEITADDITLDLGGHSVVYNNVHQEISGDWPLYVEEAAMGVHIMGYPENVRLFNGRLIQGAGRNSAHPDFSIGFNPVYARAGSGQEIAGLFIDYAGDQMIGIHLHYGSSDAQIHNNVLTDHGSVIHNRHGSGSRALILTGGADSDRPSEIHHNLVRRTRQMGVSGWHVHHNEIYIDSYDTNSFGVTRGDEAHIHDNRVFGTGYHVVAFGWGSNNHFQDNFVHLYGQGPDNRSPEYGNQESLNGFRLTQYGGSHALYENNLLEDNFVLIRGGACNEGDCSEARGIQYFSDADVVDNLIQNNLVKVEMAAEITQAAAVVTQGLRDRCGTEAPLLWKNNQLISNIVNIRMGDYYGAGCNHRFIDNELVRIGSRDDYRSMQFDVFWGVKDHYMIDSSYSGGASQDSLSFRAEGQEVHIGWSLLLRLRAADDQPAAGAEVLIQDANGQTIAAGQSDSQGEFRTHVIEAVFDPDQTLVLVPVSIAATYEGEQLSATLDVTEPTEHTLTFSSAANLIHADRFEQ